MHSRKRTIGFSIHNERGSMILVVYFVIFLLLGVGSAFVLFSTYEGRISQRQRQETVAFHIAEAGIERALYDLRQDFVGASTPSWADGDINGYAIGPSTSYYSIPYTGTTVNGGSYAVQIKNVASNEHVWIKSVGTINDSSHTIEVYVKMINLSPWDNAIFAGAGASGTMVNGNVDIRGSVHILGTGLAPGDFAVDLGGTAELVGNNYATVDPALVARVPALPTTNVNGIAVETLGAELRVKNGLVGLSGSSTVGEANNDGNTVKETVDGVYVSDGWGGNQGAASVNSDNGTTNAYDLGDSIAFPSLSDPSASNPAISHQQYLQSIGYTPTAAEEAVLANIQPTDTFTIGNASGSISMDGSGNMTVNGVVYIDNGANLGFYKDGSNKTITYTGNGSILVTGNVQLNVNLVTNGANSFPNNIVGIMTPNSIDMNEAGIDVMGLFYAETEVSVQKQTDIMGTIVSNYFDMGTNVPAIFQVPDTANNLPPGMIGGDNVYWYLLVAWIKS
ncbi:MAG: hypothetical protein KC897_05795 [Candidatus Omnitrophica bacterium]|nr:hypothetical protein [Candidatus Omnitrophota bacterium]MCB9720957.1 hypothetical protein [Candidatus Omnitrophota bacterium]